MDNQSWKPIVRAVGLGATAGMRSMTAPALLSANAVLSGKNPLLDTRLGMMCTAPAAGVLVALAAGEMVADKLPFIPDRTSLPALLGRAGSGAVVGAAAFCAAKEKPVWLGALIGAAAAVGAAYGMFHLRKFATKKLHVPDVVAGAAEDVLAVAGEMAVLRTM